MVWRLTEDAVEDIARISEDGAVEFGVDRAMDYVLELFSTFDRLAAHPYLGPKREASRSLVRLLPYRAHHILYNIESGDVVVLRVLHGRQDWINKL